MTAFEATRKTDLGVMTALRVVTIVAGAITPFVIVVLFIARLMMQDQNNEQERSLRNVFVERNEFNAWKTDVSRQLEEIKHSQDKNAEKLDQILAATQKKGK